MYKLLRVPSSEQQKSNAQRGSSLECAVCVRSCAVKSILLKSRAKRVLTPLNGVQKAVTMAIERGNLQHMIFDNRVLFCHRALAAVLGVLLKLPPIKQAMASQQIKSRFFEQVIRRAWI